MIELKNASDLKEHFPEFTREIENSARAEAEKNISDQMSKSISDAVKSERQRLLAIAKMQAGDKAAVKIAKAADALDSLPKEDNLTPQQAKDIYKFESTVNGLVQYHGLTVGQAVKKVAQNLPDDHKDYIDRVNNGGQVLKLGQQQIKPGETFEAAVISYRKQAKCSTGEAVTVVCKFFPDLHREFLDRVNKGQGGRLSE